MIIGELKSKIDAIWDMVWASGIANPMVIEQMLAETRLDAPVRQQIARPER